MANNIIMSARFKRIIPNARGEAENPCCHFIRGRSSARVQIRCGLSLSLSREPVSRRRRAEERREPGRRAASRCEKRRRSRRRKGTGRPGSSAASGPAACFISLSPLHPTPPIHPNPECAPGAPLCRRASALRGARTGDAELVRRGGGGGGSAPRRGAS